MKGCEQVRKSIVFLIAAVLIAAVLLLLWRQVRPYILQAAENCVVNAASDEILKAVDEELTQSSGEFSSFVVLEKDVSGNITAIRTNMALMNAFKNRIMNRIGENIGALDEKTLSVPLGSLFFPSFFGISGPRLKTQITSLSTVDSSISSELTEVGINQAQQTIRIHVQMNLTVLTPVGTQAVTVSSDLPVVQTVIVGVVPNTYLDTIR